MYQILETAGSGPARESTDESLVAPPPEGALRWINLEKQDEPQLALLAERFGFHPLTLEDCLHFDQRPKLESYGKYLFLVLHGFEVVGENLNVGEPLELHLFLSEKYLITVHEQPIPAVEAVWQRLKGDGNLMRRGMDYVCYLVADALVDAYFPLLDSMFTCVDELEDAILDNRKSTELTDILAFKRLLVQLRKVLSPQRDVLALLAKRGEGWVSEQTAIYFRDVYDHVLRLHESTESVRELVGNARDAYLWSASQRTNEIMKRLTILSAIFMPLTFITGFFGQNFEHLPFGSRALMFAMLASCILLPVAMIYYFIRSKWFK